MATVKIALLPKAYGNPEVASQSTGSVAYHGLEAGVELSQEGRLPR